MTGPPPVTGPLIFEALRASAYDLPEDFILRLEPGLDEDTKASLATGMRVLRLMRALWRWIFVAFVIGLLGLLFGGLTRGSPLRDLVASFGLFALAAAGIVFLYLLALSLRHHGDIHRLEAFARAMRGSSLARDIS